MTTEEELNPTPDAPINDNTNNSEDKSMWDYFVLCLTEKYFCFKGRARRKEYWSFVLFNILINIVLNFISTFLTTTGGNATGILILSFLVSIALFIPSYAVLFRRLHDVNFSGWWATAPVLGLLAASFMAVHNAAIHPYHNITDSNQIASLISFGVGIISIIMLFVVFSVIFFKSDMKENKYGPVPEGVK